MPGPTPHTPHSLKYEMVVGMNKGHKVTPNPGYKKKARKFSGKFVCVFLV